MVHSTKRIFTSLALAAGAVGLGTASAQGAIVTTFGETTAPTSNIITSFVPSGDTDAVAWVNDGPTPDFNGRRKVSESFVTPSGTDYTLDKITMRLNSGLSADFSAPSTFTIDLYEIANPGDNPVGGTLVQTQTGSMQPTAATAATGTYLTFDLDDTITLEAGKSYSYVLDFPSAASYQLIRLQVSQTGGAPDGSRVWRDIDGGGWNPIGETYTYYIQGTPVPEPAMGGLLILGLGVLARRARH